MSSPSIATDTGELDRAVRIHVYDRLITADRIPTAAEIASEMAHDPEEIRASYRRLKEGHILVLQEGDEEILMANPFSAVPTPFVVETDGHAWWGNCIWDAMGIAAMVKTDARLSTGCGDCNDSMVLLVRGGALETESGEGIIHFSVPARRWWDNIKFT